jgi:hypothetical protein
MWASSRWAELVMIVHVHCAVQHTEDAGLNFLCGFRALGCGESPYRDSCTRFSTLVLFHQSTPPRALIHGLRSFRIWPRIRRESRQYSNFSGVIDHAEINFLKPLKWSVSIASQTCNDLRNGYSSELYSLWWLTDENMVVKKPCILSL